MPTQALRPLFGIAAVLYASCAVPAQAAEWRYCLAQSPARHTVYMSAPFPSNTSMETIEAAFGEVLDRSQLSHDAVQCPRGDAQSITAMKAQAVQFNQATGNKVVQLNWRP